MSLMLLSVTYMQISGNVTTFPVQSVPYISRETSSLQIFSLIDTNEKTF